MSSYIPNSNLSQIPPPPPYEDDEKFPENSREGKISVRPLSRSFANPPSQHLSTMRILSPGYSHVILIPPKVIEQHIMRELTINGNGKAGNDGKEGSDGSSGMFGGSGNCGDSGGNGEKGENGKNLNIHLRTQDGCLLVSTEREKYRLRLNDHQTTIAVEARGGAGGEGGAGGSGGAGSLQIGGPYGGGYDSISPAGMGGSGGSGGPGGNGGDITIAVSPQDIDFLFLFKKFNLEGGKGGAAMCGGLNGYNAWNKHKGFSSASSGSEGSKGKDGSVTFLIDNKRFKSIFDLHMTGCKIEDSNGDGIVEPGDLISATPKIKNKGGMSSPGPQRVGLTLQPISEIVPHISSTIDINPIEAGQEVVLNKFFCQIPLINKPIGSSPINEKISIKFLATLSRINQILPTLSNQQFSVQVRYPVEISPISVDSTLALQGKTLFSCSVNNLSKKEIGTDALKKRAVQLFFSFSQKNDVHKKGQFMNSKNEMVLSENGWTIDIPTIQPNQSYRHSGSIFMADPSNRVCVIASLYLESVTQPQQMICIQNHQFDILSSPSK